MTDDVGDDVGASLTDTVRRAMHSESKLFDTRMRADMGVCQEVRAGL